MKIGDISRRSLLVALAAISATTAIPDSALASSFNIPVASLVLGAYGVNNWSGITTPATTVFSSSYWGTTSNYIQATTTSQTLATSTTSSQDQHITSYCRNGFWTLRLDGSGNCYVFQINEETNNFTLKYLLGYTGGDPSNSANYTTAYTLAGGTLTTVIPGLNLANTTGSQYTIGVSGFSIYLAWNGTTYWSYVDWRHCVLGQMSLWPNIGYGFRDISMVTDANAALYSVPSLNVFDVRDFGLKTLTAVGSMPAASNQLTLASNPGFAIGDAIIVEIGGESGAGQRGTLGVGGAWPNLVYPNYATLSATTPGNGSFAYTQDTLTVYYYYNGWAPALTAIATAYYQNVIAPKSLHTTIAGVSGNTLTLADSSIVATTSANVYFDNTALFNQYFGAVVGGAPSAFTVLYPAGTFAFSDSIQTPNNGTLVAGQGEALTTLKSPMGTPSLAIVLNGITLGGLASLTAAGNFRFQGFGLNSWSTSSAGASAGVLMQLCTSCLVSDVDYIDTASQAFAAQYSTDCWVVRCSATFNDGQQNYEQWAFQWVNSLRGGTIDCVLTSPILIAGFNTFASYGTAFIRSVSQNGVFASNSSGGFLFEQPSITITPNSQYSVTSFSASDPIFNINSNIWNSGGQQYNMDNGGVIHNPYVSQLSAINDSGNFLQVFNINNLNPNIDILADYYSLDGNTTLGLIDVGSSSQPGVNATGENTFVRGLRFKGGAPIELNGTWSQAQDCIVDTTSGGATNKFVNCVTNAYWLAHGGN